MKKINYLFIIFVLFLFVSCKSKKNVVSILPRPVLNVDSVRPDSSAAIDGLFAPDHSQLADLKVSTKKQKKTAKKEAATEQEERNLVLRGTKITSSTVNVPATYSGIDRVVEYDFTHRDVPEAFEGFRIAFISDCEYVEPLFAALARVKTPMGTFGVMGNNDYERCHDEIIRTMKHYGMRPLEHEVDTLRKDGQQIILAGVRNPFDLKQNGVSPTLALSPNDFVILLVHTPDYVEDVSVANTDIALAGHTHGGQVRVFGYAPIQNSHYGTRFLTGLAYNSTKMPLIVTNGIGTSQMPVRIGAPAEIIMITLHRLKE